MRGGIYLSNREWQVLAPMLPRVKKRKDGKGRPAKAPRAVLDGILWILFSGAPWYMLPKDYPSYQTCHRYFQLWVQKGVLQKMLNALSTYHAKRLKPPKVTFIDGSFASAKKGGAK
jgi:transposase